MKNEKFTQYLRLTFLSIIFTASLFKVDLMAQQACAITTTDFAFNANTSVAIPTGPAVVSTTINVVGAGPIIADLTVMTNITHTFAGDLDITLTSPAGTIVTLTTDNGGGNDNVFDGTLWDDDANPGGQVPYTANNGLVGDHTYVNLTLASPLAPEEPLAAFNGENPNGIWTLTVSDDAGGDGGSLNNWFLNIKTAVTIPVVTVTNHPSIVPVAIPAGPAVITSTINVAGVQTYLRNLRLTTNITHTFSGDLDMTLTSPAGTVVSFSTDNGGGNDNVYAGTLWDNDANPLGQVPYTNNAGLVSDHLYTNLVVATPLTPEESFGNFFGENPNGTWTLTISDDAAGDAGNLASWNIELSTLPNQTCNFTLPIAPLNFNAAADVCAANVTLNVPPTTGLCDGVTYSYQIDNGPIIPIVGTSVQVSIPLGAHIITWYSTTPCGTVTATQNVNVSDVTGPSITCPADINIILDPGACDAAVSYTVEAFDNCGLVLLGGAENAWQVPPTVFPHGFGAITVVSNTTPGGVMFNMTNTSTEDIYIKSLEVRFGSVAFGAIPAVVPVSVYTTIGNTYVGQVTNPAGWSAVGINIPVTVAGPNSEFSPFNLPGNGIVLAAGQTKGVYVMGTTHSLVYSNAANSTLTPFTNAHLSLLSGVSSPGLFAAGGFGPPRTPNIIFHYALESELDAFTQTSGLPSGSSFPIGTTTNCFVATDIFGNTATCCFDVTITEFPFASTTLACNDNVQVSLDESCVAIIDASMILSGDVYGCYDDYIVEIQIGGNWVPAIVNSSHIGQTIVIRITDPETGNSCWGTISVEDKIPPVITCTNFEIICGESLEPNFEPITQTATITQVSGAPIGPNAGTVTTSTMLVNLPSDAEINDIDVYVDIAHTFVGDLNIQLISPTGVITDLWNGQCGGTDNMNLTFDDEGTPGPNALCVDINDGPAFHLQPVAWQFATPVLDQYDGTSPNGTWTLMITDEANIDGGTLNLWSLIINYTATFAPIFSDNCGEVDLTYTDTESGDPCEGLLITRHWVVTDESGNSAECDQLITVLPLDVDSVVCPAAFVGHCGDDTDPSNTGWPTINDAQITDENSVCNIFVGYWDKELNDCGNGVKIIRTWTILDWCTQSTFECVQVIKLTDDEAPILDCPSDLTVGTDFWYCYSSVSVPKPDVFDECGSAFTLSLTSSAGVIVNFGNNYVINQLGIGTHTVTWTATDECGNAASCSFTITVVDDVVPVANCDEHTVVALTNDGPFGVTLVPAHVFDDGSYDNCGPVTFRVRRMDSCIDFDWTTEGACIDHIPGGVPPVNSRDRGTVSRPCVPFACCDVGAGPIMVELEVTDASGNRNFCMVEAIVQDKISPFVECPPDITVSCDFWFNVQEGTFGDSPLDHAGNGNGNLDEDPLSAVFGNMFDAFQYNDDESVRQDIIINDPGNPQVNQPHFWGIDGWADDNCEVNLQVRVRVIDDCSGGELPPGAPAGAVKLIERRFSASDGNEGIAPGTCTQRIWVVDFEPFFITDQTCNNPNPNDGVIWPCDVTLHDCPEEIGDTGEPTIFDDACSLIGVAYEDTRFDFVDGACFKILRKWSIIDWCQYNPLTGEGIWHYIQVIKVHDEEGPVFLTCPGNQPVVLCVADTGVSLPNNNQAFLGEENPLASSCSAHLNLCQTVHETCSDFITYDVKFYMNNGDEFIYVKTPTVTPTDSNHNAQLCFDTRQNSSLVIRNNGIPYNSPFCGDYHRILWSAEDGCGNWSHCEYLIRLEDCKQPSPVCINGLSTVVMPIGGQVTVWAKDFNASSFDDCTPAADLLYSFSGDNYQPSFTYTCENVPAFGVELSVNIWVADGGTDDNCNGQIGWGERNKDFCTTTIVITDNNDICTEEDSNLAGEILTDEDGQPVELVAVTLTNPNHVFPTYVTVENGKYNFFITVAGENTVTPGRNDTHKNGVSTLDLVRIQKHLLGIEAINNPYDLIAADANNSQTVSAIDLIELRKLILGIYSELPSNKSWRFVDKDFEFADPTHPWPFAEQITVSDMSTNHLDENFVAIKVGDVNNTVQANANQIMPRNGNGVIHFVANDRMVNVGEMVDVAISSTDFASIEGYQFTMQTKGLEFRGVEAGAVSMSDENMGVFTDMITASWHKVGGVSASSSEVLFTLQFQVTAAGRLSSMITLNSRETEAEAYNTKDDIKDLKLTFRESGHEADFALYQNEPNPFKGKTMIGFDLPVTGKVTLTLFDVTGRVLLVKDQDAVKGYNTISVSSKDLSSIGVLYYRLEANEYSATKKMVIIE